MRRRHELNERFSGTFTTAFEGVVFERYELDAALIQRSLGDPNFKEFVTTRARGEAYRRIRAEQDEPAG